MDERAGRIGRNEAIFREVNEQVESLNKRMSQVSDKVMHIVCECGDVTCAERFTVPIRKYEEIRSDSALFFIVPGHEEPDVEDVVAEGDGFSVVRKRAGEAERIAEETDPRS